MGNNAAFTAFEASVMACYKHGVLTKALLSDLMEPYRGMDIDSGGMENILSKDGLDVVEVVIKVWGLKLPPYPKLPKDYNKWTDEQRDENDEWQELKWSLFHRVTDKFGWE